jgi:hypothetical protein
MCLGLVTLSDATIQRVVDDAQLGWRLAAPAPSEEARKEAGEADDSESGRGKKTKKAKRTDSGPAIELGPGEGVRINIDRAWHGIHYLLTGTAWEGDPPLDFLVNGGRFIGAPDEDHGPLRAFTASETKAILEIFSTFSPYGMRKRYNPRDMMAKEVYPPIWSHEEESLSFLIDNVERLRSFMRQAVETQMGMLIFLQPQ